MLKWYGMPTNVYEIGEVFTMDGIRIPLEPLKIKYMKRFMEIFQTISGAEDDQVAIDTMSECVRICMEQFAPEYSEDLESVQDNFDLGSIYQIMDIAAGVSIKEDDEKTLQEQAAEEDKKGIWDDLDLAKLETEVFLLGIWKNYDELESSLCVQELMQILSSRRELEYEEKKFLAAIQGINLDEATGSDKGQQEWENLKARVASGGKATDSKDILALQGTAARQAGFGIGYGLDYEVVKD